MAAELGLLSLTQVQNLAQYQQRPKPGMWESWEVRDTSSAIGATWPPRSYTCSFCRREFRSAQALGGHMNVHRRERARLHQSPSGPDHSAPLSPPIIFQSPELVARGGGFCLFYPIQSSDTAFAPTADTTSPLISIAPHHGSPLLDLLPGKVGSMGENDNMKEIEYGSDGEVDLELRLGL